MAGTEQGIRPRQPRGDKGPERVTTVRRATIIGVALAVLVALIAGAAGSLATARLTDRQSEVSQRQAEIAQLTTKVAKVTADATAERDRLTAENAGLQAQASATAAQIKVLEADKASLADQLAQILNPAPGATPTAALTAIWVQPVCNSYGFHGGTSHYSDCVKVVVCVEIENTSASDASIGYSYSQFTALSGNSYSYPPSLGQVAGFRPATPLMDGQLGPGEKRRGELVYDVPPPAATTGVPPAVLARLVWNAGFGETPQIALDLPAPKVRYQGGGC